MWLCSVLLPVPVTPFNFFGGMERNPTRTSVWRVQVRGSLHAVIACSLFRKCCTSDESRGAVNMCLPAGCVSRICCAGDP